MHFIRLASYGTLIVVILETPRIVMGDEDRLASCDDYLARAVGEQDVEKQKEWFEKAYAADPDREKEILRVAEELAVKNVWKRTNGHGSIS